MPPAAAPLSPSAHVDTFTRDHLPPPELWPVIEFTTPELAYPGRLNAAAALVDVPAEALGAGRAALRTPHGETWTYGELRTRANQVAQVLTEDLGLVAGQRVLLRSPNNPWTVAAWLGVLKAGGVAVTTMAALRARELGPIAERTQPCVALVDHRFAEDARVVRDTVLPSMTVIAYGGGEPDDLTARAAAKSGEFANVDTAADDVALLAPTSGSTGVREDHHALPPGHPGDRRHVRPARPQAGAGRRGGVQRAARLHFRPRHARRLPAAGRRVRACLSSRPPPRSSPTLVAQQPVTVLATAPTAYKAILRDGLEGKLAGLRTAVSAGEHIPQGTWERLRDSIGLKVIDGIGSTELLHIFITAAGDDIRPGATGKPLPGVRAAILGPDGTELGPLQPGRLGVIGPVGCRYLDDERQRNYVTSGWNTTGDVFYRDADGYFYYQARSDNMILSSGYNIGGPEVEAAIDTHPDVLESAVVARPDAERGSVVCAFVVLRDGVPADATAAAAKAKEIQVYVKNVLAPYKYPRDVRFTAALPRNASGKLQHFALRAVLEKEGVEAETAATRKETLA